MNKKSWAWLTVLLLSLLIGLATLVFVTRRADKSLPNIQPLQYKSTIISENSNISTDLSRLAEDFLIRTEFDDLSVTVLVRDPETKHWLGGHYQPERLWYPASVAKLACLPGFANYSRQSDGDPQFLEDLTKVYQFSSNEVFGRLIDKVTATDNYISDHYDNERYSNWFERRRYFEKVLSAYNLLEDQRLVMKTYPSNTSSSPEGAEDFSFQTYGGNRLRTDLTARLLEGLVLGRIEPGFHETTLQLLQGKRMQGLNIIGWGLPPDTEFYGKVGYGVGRFCDCQYLILPNGQEVIIAIFSITSLPSDAYDPDQSTQATLGVFADRIIEKLDLYPEELDIIMSVEDESTKRIGEWQMTSDTSLFPSLYRTAKNSGDSVIFQSPRIPSGTYEIHYAYADIVSGLESASLSIASDDGESLGQYRLDLSRRGNRWFWLQEVRLPEGVLTFSISDEVREASKMIGISRIRLRKRSE